MNRNAGYRTSFYKELPASDGQPWLVPVWSQVIPAADHASAINQAIKEFEITYGCLSWTERANLIEINEAIASGAAADTLPQTKRIVRPPQH
jgi:hypothetical protein